MNRLIAFVCVCVCVCKNRVKHAFQIEAETRARACLLVRLFICFQTAHILNHHRTFRHMHTNTHSHTHTLKRMEVRRLGKILGHGSEALVQRCSSSLGLDLVVKRPLKMGNNLGNEYRMLALCDHPNIVQTFGLDDELGLMLEYCDGGNLDDYVKQHSHLLGTREFDRLLAALLGALAYLHERDIVHMDVKGANILLTTSDKSPKLTDFGYTRLRTEPCGARGSRFYMAPEVCAAWLDGTRSHLFTSAVDIYSFGLMLLYFCTNERHPYESYSTSEEWWKAALKGEFTPAEEHFSLETQQWTLVEQISPLYVTIISRCLKFDPGERATARELLDLLCEQSACTIKQ